MQKLGSNLEKVIDEKNFSILSNRLGLSEEEVKEFVGISVESALENQATVEEKGKLFIIIKVEVRNNAILQKLQEGIIHYIEQNDFVKVRVDQKKKYYTELIKEISIEIENIEVLKGKIREGTFKSDGGTYMVDPTNPFSKSIEFFRDRLKYQQDLELVNSVQVVEGFTPFNRKVKPKLSIMLPVGFLIGLFGGFGIIFLRYVIRLGKEDQ
jgi:hypothetical protein